MILLMYNSDLSSIHNPSPLQISVPDINKKLKYGYISLKTVSRL